MPPAHPPPTHTFTMKAKILRKINSEQMSKLYFKLVGKKTAQGKKEKQSYRVITLIKIPVKIPKISANKIQQNVKMIIHCD